MSMNTLSMKKKRHKVLKKMMRKNALNRNLLVLANKKKMNIPNRNSFTTDRMTIEAIHNLHKAPMC